MKDKISIVNGAHSTTKKERITETVQYTIIFILAVAISTWLLHLTDGWLVIIVWALLGLVYSALVYDTWTRQSTVDHKIIDNPVYENDKE